ncbi:Maf family protein [Paracoccus sp. 1_MG-2023]|uniref:Maf family protein n=1 Tax=unclassified Paracoccus (in: a-proteobacteria) TaxID=2688777 RepID=UPI001C0A5C97|nr:MULTISPECIES: Maf family protein [unclassified Paracoccus (in: a-proteobacteria)]MBU2958485.1 septum formation protein Maf [Paracoccus sp. C2R09]MDO6668530.1 Maf family protein [Paracoccus sp. 1_MG-2023]
MPGIAQRRLILGSASPRRLELLSQIGIRPAALRPADIDETPLRDENARDYVRRMARQKAEALSLSDNEVLLTADTTVSVGRRILGKPEDRDEAASFMRLMSGRRHLVLTALAVRDATGIRERLVTTRVRMRPIDDASLQRYLDIGDWQGKAGGYAIQGAAAAFIPWIEGSHSAVVGLPLSETASLLASAGIFPAPEGENP